MDYNYIDLWDKAESRNHSYWTFYAFLVAAIAGWLFVEGSEIKRPEQTIMTVGLFVFSCFNLTLIIGTARLLEVIADYIKNNVTNKNSDPFAKPIMRCIGKYRMLGSVALHIIIDICVIVAIWT